MNENDKISIISTLLMGEDIKLKGLTLKNYKLNYIFKELGLLLYYGLINVCNLSPEEIFSDEKEIIRFKEFLNVFTDREWIYHPSHNILSTNDIDDLIVIDKDNVSFILEVFRMIYCIHKTIKESEREDIDDEMRELLREFEEEEDKIHKAKGIGNITLLGIIKGVSCKHNSINLINIWDYTIYQLMCSFYALDKIDNEARIMTAIYSGTIDGQKIKQSSIHWANDNTI